MQITLEHMAPKGLLVIVAVGAILQYFSGTSQWKCQAAAFIIVPDFSIAELYSSMAILVETGCHNWPACLKCAPGWDAFAYIRRVRYTIASAPILPASALHHGFMGTRVFVVSRVSVTLIQIKWCSFRFPTWKRCASPYLRGANFRALDWYTCIHSFLWNLSVALLLQVVLAIILCLLHLRVCRMRRPWPLHASRWRK